MKNPAALTRDAYTDIQGIVLNGYKHLTCTRFLFLKIGEAKRARAWLAGLLPQIRTGGRRPAHAVKPDWSINVALSHAGLDAFGLSPDALQMFPREFQEGMGAPNRARVLGDWGDSAPEAWDLGGPATDPLHVVVMLYARNDDVILEQTPKLQADWEAHGLTLVYQQDTGRISEKEPFGFKDGIAQPYFAGTPNAHEAAPHGETLLAAGELLLGYANEYGTLPPSPLVPAAHDPANALPTGPGGLRDFGRNGTYLVFRKLAQDVEGFWKFARENAPDGDAKRLAAKLVGRWPDGTPLALSPDAPAGDARNDFGYAKTDPYGHGCPIGSHVRRTNPRDALVPNPQERSLKIANRHRILRRGRHYEDKGRTDTWRADGIEHGLCFLALNADLQRQFEFIQQTWINSPKFNGLVDNKDPLVGDNDGTGHMAIQGCPARHRLTGFPRFVRVRGGGYFFLPSVPALYYLTTLGEP